MTVTQEKGSIRVGQVTGKTREVFPQELFDLLLNRFLAQDLGLWQSGSGSFFFGHKTEFKRDLARQTPCPFELLCERGYSFIAYLHDIVLVFNSTFFFRRCASHNPADYLPDRLCELWVNLYALEVNDAPLLRRDIWAVPVDCDMRRVDRGLARHARSDVPENQLFDGIICCQNFVRSKLIVRNDLVPVRYNAQAQTQSDL